MTNVKSLALHAQAPNEGILWDESKRVKDSEGIDLIEATNPECEGKGAILTPVLQEAIRRKEV